MKLLGMDVDGSFTDVIPPEGTEFAGPDTRLDSKQQRISVDVVSSPFLTGHTAPDFVPEDVYLFGGEDLLVSFALSGITGLVLLIEPSIFSAAFAKRSFMPAKIFAAIRFTSGELLDLMMRSS